MQKGWRMTDHATNQPLPDSEKQALKAIVKWRGKDRAAFTNKQNRAAQHAEYIARDDLREAADQIGGDK